MLYRLVMNGPHMKVTTMAVQVIQTSLERALDAAASRIMEIVSNSTPNIISNVGVRSIFSDASWLTLGSAFNAAMADDASSTCALKIDRNIQLSVS